MMEEFRMELQRGITERNYREELQRGITELYIESVDWIEES